MQRQSLPLVDNFNLFQQDSAAVYMDVRFHHMLAVRVDIISARRVRRRLSERSPASGGSE